MDDCQPCGVNPQVSPLDISVHIIPLETPIVHLDSKQAFSLLDEKEKNYAYYLCQADWAGAKICLLQCSVESPIIFSLLQLVFSSSPSSDIVNSALDKGLTHTQIDQAFMYAASFYGNMGNYKSFGDSKFIPALSPEDMYTFLSASVSDKSTVKIVDEIWEECVSRMYSLLPRQ